MFIRHPFTLINPIHFEDKPPNPPVTDAEIEAQVEKDLKSQEPSSEVKDKVEDKEEKIEDTELKVEAEKAAQLYAALQDPAQAAILVKAMAQGLGLKISDVETKEDKKEAVKSIKDAVKEELGTDYAFLADKLGSVFEKILTKEINEKTSAIEARLNQDAEEKSKEKLGIALDSAFDQYANINDKIKNSVYALVDEMPPTKGTDPVKYWDRLIHTAARENKISLIEKGSKNESTEARRNRNRSDAQNRLRSEDTADEKGVDVGSNINNLTDAIRKGMADAEKALQEK